MDSVSVPLRSSGKKMRKRRELDALVAHSLAKRACNTGKRQAAGNGINSQDQLLSQSTDDQEEYSLSKIQISKRHRKHYSFLRTCAPLLFIFSVFLLFSFMYWLYFDLREQLSDHRNKIEQVSALCLSMPETLQKLHESSKLQEQNQTALSQKIYEIQQRIESFEKELKENLRKKEDAPEGVKTVDLKDTVSGFGAKIQSLESDVKTLKEDSIGIKQAQQTNKIQLDTLRKTVDTVANSTQITLTSDAHNESNIWMKNFTEKCSNDLKNVSNQLALINDTFSQKIKTMDDEMHDHQTKLDGLNESFANVSSHVTSIETEWPKFKQTNQKYDLTITAISNDIVSLKSNVNNITTAIRNIQTNQMNENKKNTNLHQINESVPLFKNSQDQINELQSNPSASKVTLFPAELLSADKPQQIDTEKTSQPSQNNTVTQPITSSTTIPAPKAK